MRRADYLRPLLDQRPERVGRDRLEILTALIGGPSFDPTYRGDIIMIPGGHPIYRWECLVEGCERPRTGGADLCALHQRDWAAQSTRGVGKAAFVTSAVGLDRHVGAAEVVCRICPDRPAAHTNLRLCQRHLGRWNEHQQREQSADFDEWVGQERSFPGYGCCTVAVCPNLAGTPLRLCSWHTSRLPASPFPRKVGLVGG